MIEISEELIKQIESHGERTFPHECGGMLIVNFAVDGEKSVVELLPMENAMAEAEQHNRVLITPKDVMRAERYAREKNLMSSVIIIRILIIRRFRRSLI